MSMAGCAAYLQRASTAYDEKIHPAATQAAGGITSAAVVVSAVPPIAPWAGNMLAIAGTIIALDRIISGVLKIAAGSASGKPGDIQQAINEINNATGPATNLTLGVVNTPPAPSTFIPITGEGKPT